MLCLTEATVPANTREILVGRLSLEAEWNPGAKLVAWMEGPGRVRPTMLPSLEEIDAAERQNSTKRHAGF
jgi:hypothetical protein